MSKNFTLELPRCFWKAPDIALLSKDYDIICLQETLLQPHKTLYINGFHSFKLDVSHPSLRGICILSRQNLKVSLVDLSVLHHPSIEIIHVDILFKSFSLLLVSIYRHPNVSTPLSVFEDIFSLHLKYNNLVILGDLNTHHPLWGADRSDPGNIISRVTENHGIRLLNDESPTLLHSSYGTFSTIDHCTYLQVFHAVRP